MGAPSTTEAALEALSDAHDAYLRAGDFMTCADPRGHIHAFNRLHDAAIAAGLDRRAPVRTADWAAERLAAWRLSATADDREPLVELDCALAAFRRAGGFHAVTHNPAHNAVIRNAYVRLCKAADAAGYDHDTCQLPTDAWAADRLAGMYAREAA